MPDLKTPNFGWTLPTVGADAAVWGTLLNANTSDMDSKLALGLTALSNIEAVITTASTITLSAPTTPAGQTNVIYGQRGGVARWAIVMPEGSPESTGNAGSNFLIKNYSDTGADLGAPLQILRSSGQVLLTGGLNVSGGPLISSAAAVFNSTLAVAGAATLSATLVVGGAVTLNSTLTVATNGTFGGTLGVGSNLVVTGLGSLGGITFPGFNPGHLIQFGFDGANLRVKVDSTDLGPILTGTGGNIGEIKMYAGATAPAGYKLCDGAVYLNTDIPLLAPILNNKYGGVIGTSNAVPNMALKFPTGPSAASGVAVGDTGGESSHVLSATEMPSHTHTVTDPGHVHSVTDPQHHHTVGTQVYGLAGPGGNNITAFSGSGGPSSTDNASTGISIQSHTTGVTNANTGGGAAHNNIPPYLALNFIIKYQ